jgi:hypothetical protein
MSIRADYCENIYSELMREQEGQCAICGRTEDDVCEGLRKRRRHALDHCHSSQKIRGALCRECNSGLGMFRDSIPLLRKAIEYLSRPTDGRPYWPYSREGLEALRNLAGTNLLALKILDLAFAIFDLRDDL